MTMLKDNHITSAGSITNAIISARSAGGFSLKIEVEARNESEALEATIAGADVVMLDNFDPGDVGVVAARMKAIRKDVLVEISGGIEEGNLRAYCIPGVDVISTSATHQGVKHVDFSLKIVKGAIG
jgi:nicotinate-nucleotide pyrophosphorylase